MTPFDYLTRWRMTCAKQQLRTSTRSVADTALELGYQSEAAFHRAFTRHYGVGPGAFRRSLAG
jgi:AraC-like DNA-binding protein